MSFERDPTVEFWHWFKEFGHRISRDPTDPVFVEELDSRIRDLGDFAWEIGPGKDADWFLAISPGGDPDKLEATKRIISAAPEIPGWEFHPAKPAREWDLVFELERFDGFTVTVDASKWRFVLVGYPDGEKELLVEAPKLLELPEDEQNIAIALAIDGVVGELAHFDLYDSFAVFDVLPERFKGAGQPFRLLARHAKR